MKTKIFFFGMVASLLLFHVPAQVANGQQVAPYFNSRYNLRDIGAVPGLPGRYGGLTFKSGDANTLLIGGDGNSAEAAIYEIGLLRGMDGHITGFTGTSRYFAAAPGGDRGGIDGGLSYGPGGVLFYTAYPDNSIGQIKAGSTSVNKLVRLSPLGVVGEVGSLVFVPPGFPGVGRLKILDFGGGIWYDAAVTADGQGTFDIMLSGVSTATGLDAEGAFFVKAGNPLFATLISG